MPRPFAPNSTYARLLIKTWKKPVLTPMVGPDSPELPEYAEAEALNAYSIVNDRRIPVAVAVELEDFYRRQPDADRQLARVVLDDFERIQKPRLDAVENEKNYRYGGGRPKRPIPSIFLISAVRLSKSMVSKLCIQRSKLSPLESARFEPLGDCLKPESNPTSRSPEWKWLTDSSGLAPDLESATSSPVVQRLRLLLNLLNAVRKADRIQWSAGSFELERHRECLGHRESPELGESWLAPVGVNYRSDEVVLVFKFPAIKAQCLYRPTHLDARFYREHFPSPDMKEEPWPGHAMYLTDTTACPEVPLIVEYVHPPVSFKFKDLHAIAITRSASQLTRLPEQRRLHWSRLHKNYPSCDLSHRLFPAHTGIERCDFASCGCTADSCRNLSCP